MENTINQVSVSQENVNNGTQKVSKQQVMELYNQGFKKKEIAEKLNLNPAQMNKVAKQLELKFRNTVEIEIVD